MGEFLFQSYFNYKFPQPQYLGAKYRHLSWIGEHIPSDTNSVLDAFAGSQSVAYYFKQKGFQVFTNDFLNFNHQIGIALIENKDTKLTDADIQILLRENSDQKEFNLMEKLFTDIFFVREECKFLDAFRSNIKFLPEDKQSLALSIMNRSLTRKVTMGHFAHTKALDYANNAERVKRNRNLARSIKDLFLDLVPIYNNAIFDNGQNNKSFNMDAIDLISNLKEKVQVLYLDPPYCGSHSDYQSFYHLLETYTVYWKDKDFLNGTKRYFPKRESGFEMKKDIVNSLTQLFTVSEKIPYWLISYNDRSFPNKEMMVSLISKYRKVEVSHKPYHNDVGGKGSVRGSNELLFICY